MTTISKSIRVPAWRRIGQSVNQAMTAEDALKLGGLDFQVRVSENHVTTTVGDKSISIADRFMTYAELPNGDVHGIGVVGSRYTPIQNREAFDLLNNIVDDSGAHFDTAGTLGGYNRCYISLRLPETIQVANGADSLETYLHCVNSHDGTSSFQIYTMFLRQICTNGLKGFRAGSSISLRHTINSSTKVQDARTALQLVFAEQDAFKAEVESLINKPMSNNDFQKFVDTLVPLPDFTQVSNRAFNNASEVRDNLFDLWNADTQKNVANTAWAAYNTVTEYVDWFSPTRTKYLEDEYVRRAQRAMGGQSPLVARAHELLVTL